jgi:hypothetical protein
MTGCFSINRKKICKECRENNSKSTIKVENTIDVPVGGQEEYWDEDGKFHKYKDSKTRTRVIYKCSNNHTWHSKLKKNYYI